MRIRLFAAVAGVLLIAGTVFAQNSRRDRENPELVVASDGRIGSCDSLQFTKDGKYLLAIGDDKVVRIWPCHNGQLHKDGMQVLRWSVWREQRGAIFALALSPDDDNKYVAIAGIGPKTSDVAVLERSTGKMIHHAVAERPKGELQPNAIWSIAYAPDGKSIAFGDSFGGVWTWDFKKAPQRLERHPDRPSVGETNQVRLVHFFDKDTLVSVAENGTVCLWDPAKPDSKPDELKNFGPKGKPLFRVALSPDEKWYAAAVDGQPSVVLRKVDGKEKPIEIDLKDHEFPRAVAFDADSKRLAISVAHTLENKQGFSMEGEDHIAFYDLQTRRFESDGPNNIYRAWFIAFHPNKKDLAIAGGDNSEVKLWNLAKMDRPVSTMDGVGKAIWDVAISKDGKQVAFRDQRNPQWDSPNNRGEGPWRVFHLPRREWTDAAEFAKVKVERRLEYKGWTVEPGKSGDFHWYVVTPGNEKLPLYHDNKREGLPFCWTFLPPSDNRPLRLAVGHLWGVSIYELTETKAKFVRLLTGHQGYVTALAASEDGSYLLSASMDQTLSGWNLNYRLGETALGASFEIRGNKLFVTKVELGSPGWETGLEADDEVVDFYFDAKPVGNGPKDWLMRLQNPQPGTEHYFVIQRKDIAKPFPLKTSVRQRPLWRFFPTRDNEWILWMWQNAYYDTSTKGDSYIGWVVNSADENREPAFYPLEQFRAIYERANVLDKLLESHSTAEALREALGDNPLPPQFDKRQPPFATLKLAAETTKDDDVKATLLATPPGTNPDNRPERTELWINDFRFDVDKNPQQWNKDKDDKSFRKVLTIPNAKLRAGENVLTFQVYNRLGGRAEAVVKLQCTRNARPPHLYGLAVGVNDYGAVKTAPGGRGKPDNLKSAVADAEAIQKSWLAQTALYKGTDMFLELDTKATRAQILDGLDRLAKVVEPEDRCIIFLAGHGAFVEHKGKSSTWLFLCPDFDIKKPEETSITSEVLYEKLAAIAGRKLVILDACHSGEAAANPVRPLVPGGRGPIIMASCNRNQFAYEDQDKLKHGLFTYALIRALGDDFNKAAKGKKELDARDLYEYTREEMPELLKSIRVPEGMQVPVLFAPPGKTFPVAKAKE